MSVIARLRGKNPLLLSFLLCLFTFCLTSAAFAATAPFWPTCATPCVADGPGGATQNLADCVACCDGCNTSQGNTRCLNCCTAYNFGNPNGPTHCL